MHDLSSVGDEYDFLYSSGFWSADASGHLELWISGFFDLDCCLIVGGWALQMVSWYHDFSLGFWQYNEIAFFV